MSFSNMQGQQLDGTMVGGEDLYKDVGFPKEPQYDAVTRADNPKVLKTMPIEQPVNDGQIVDGGSFDIDLVEEFEPQEFDTNVVTTSATAKEAKALNDGAVTSRKVSAGDTVTVRADNPEVQDVYSWKERLNPRSEEGQRYLADMLRNVYMATGDKKAANQAVLKKFYDMDDQYERGKNKDYWLNKGINPDDIEQWIDTGGDIKEPAKKSYTERVIQQDGQSYVVLMNNNDPNDFTRLRKASMKDSPEYVSSATGGWLKFNPETQQWGEVISGKEASNKGVMEVDTGDKIKLVDKTTGKVVDTLDKGVDPAKKTKLSSAEIKKKEEDKASSETRRELIPKVDGLISDLRANPGATGPIDRPLNVAGQYMGFTGTDTDTMAKLESVQKDLFFNVKSAFGQMTDSDVSLAMKWYGLDPNKSAEYNIKQLETLKRDLIAAEKKADGGAEFVANLRSNAGGQSAPTSGGKTIVKTGTDKASGRRVAMYSDGTIAPID